jgi:hypothetical protein
MTKSLALDPHDPSLVEIYYHHAPAFRRVSLRLFGIGISLVYCLIHLHTAEMRSAAKGSPTIGRFLLTGALPAMAPAGGRHKSS